MELGREVLAVKFKGLLTDRQPLIGALEQETASTAVYQGAPSFRYVIGDYTVLRDGSLEVADGRADRALLSRLASNGLIEAATDEPAGIAFELDSFTGRTLVNIVNTLAARGKLINKAIGRPNAVHMGADLVRTLKSENPDTVAEFMGILHRCGGERAIRGLRLTGGKLVFTGFPDDDTFHALAEHIVNAALSLRWIKAKEPTGENEKYTFRVWLNALGLKGTEYANARAQLLRNLSGDTAYRTEAQRAAFNASRRRRRIEPEFIVL